jgi:SAM-dependent methyltransferase
MGQEVDLMRHYPKQSNRMDQRQVVTKEQRRISRMFSFDYFDGDRIYGYGGHTYHPRFWSETVQLFSDYYSLTAASSILDVGCAKGFMLKDFVELTPGMGVTGIDISGYAIDHADPTVRANVVVGNATDLPYPDGEFDLVVSINTIHNLPHVSVLKALREIERVGNGNSFVMVDGWRDEQEKVDLESWVLTAQTMLHVDDWCKLFDEAGYTGDYSFWSPC